MTDRARPVAFTGETMHSLPANRVLESAVEANLRSCLVLGYRQNGERYVAYSPSDAAEILWMLEKAKADLMEAVDV